MQIVKGSIRVLVVAKQDRMRDSLRALLTMSPLIDIVGLVDDVPSALTRVEKCCPDLVLLDTNLPNGDAQEVLASLKSKCALVRCVAMIGDVDQLQTVRIAGADEVLLKGFTTTELFQAIDRLTDKSN